MAIPRTRPFQSLQTQRGNPQLQQLLQLIAQQSQRPTAPIRQRPFTEFETPIRQGINRSVLPPARVNPLNALDRFQAGRAQPPAVAGTPINPGLAPGLPGGPSFVPGSPANVKENFTGTTIPAPVAPGLRGAGPPGSTFSDITAGNIRGPGIPPVVPAPVGQVAGPSPAAGAAAARGLQGFQPPGQKLVDLAKEASRNSKEDIAFNAKGSVKSKQGKRIQDISKRVAGAGRGAKDVPGWALPLMMMGLTMAASKRTDSLGAFSEGGLAGLQLFMNQKASKRKATTEERKLRATEEKARAATTTAQAATVTAEAAKIRAETGGKGTRGPIRKRFDDLQGILQSPGGAKLKRFFPDKKFAEVVGGMDDQEFELVKAGFSQLAAGVTFGEEITAAKVNQILEGARLATRREPGPAVTGSGVTQIQRQGGRLVAQ